MVADAYSYISRFVSAYSSRIIRHTVLVLTAGYIKKKIAGSEYRHLDPSPQGVVSEPG